MPVEIPQSTKKRMSFSWRIQEAEAVRDALQLVSQGVGGLPEEQRTRVARIVKGVTRRLAREQEWVAAGGKVSHAD